MEHIENIYWGEKGSGVLVISKFTKRILINLRSECVSEPNTWGIWGGAIDTDKSPEESAIKELFEESGYNSKINLIPAHIFISPYKNFIYYNFLGLIDKEFEPVLDWESNDYKWVTLEDLIRMKNLHFGLKILLEKNINLIQNYC